MKYLVMETHPAYAVLLDEKGRFLKAANLNYQVGDTVQNIIELKSPSSSEKRMRLLRRFTAAAAAAACFCLVFFGYYQPNYVAYGTIRIRINPEVEMTVSRAERVLDLDGLNADGIDLIEGYDYSGKDRKEVTNDLIRRAMDMGYLSDGDSVSVLIDSQDTEWRLREEENMRTQMEEEYGAQIVIHIGETPEPEPDGAEEPMQVVIPVTPEEPPVAPAEEGDSGYGGDDDGAGVSDYDTEDYDDGSESYNSGISGSIEDYEDGDSGYDGGDAVSESQPSSAQEDGDSGYDDSGYGDDDGNDDDDDDDD